MNRTAKNVLVATGNVHVKDFAGLERDIITILKYSVAVIYVITTEFVAQDDTEAWEQNITRVTRIAALSQNEARVELARQYY